MKEVKSKITKEGIKVAIMEAAGKGEYFAKGRKYWIVYRDNHPRCAINVSDSLRYITKKFDKIS